MTVVSVTIPVGPFESNKRWLRECMDSVREQTLKPYDIVLIDDGARLDEESWLQCWDYNDGVYYADYLSHENIEISIHSMPWRTGVAHAFNYGVMLAKAECVFMLGSDDTLEPLCLERCMRAYELNNKLDGYYSVPLRYMDTGDIQTIPCNAAMVTKGLWHRTGGFPVESATGAGDAALLSILKAHYDDKGERLVQWVGTLTDQPETPLYNYRRHPDIYTHKQPWPIIDTLRSILTETYKEPEWGNNY